MARYEYRHVMRFDGQVFFRFDDRQVWEFYRFARSLAETGAEVALEWTPMPDEGPAATVFLGLSDPQDRGRFLHAMLGLVHLDDRDAADASTVAAAVDAARVAPGSVPTGALAEIARLVEDLGVSDVPSLYRHGPAVRITLNGASTTGDVQARAEAILAVLDDDGIWGLTKP